MIFSFPRVLAVCLLIGFSGSSFAQSTVAGVQAAPSYDNFQPPSDGGTYTDPVFGSAITRVSNALATPNIDRGGMLTSITDEYATASPFNSDNSRFILLHQSYFGLYDGNGKFLGDLPLEINSSSEPRWSRKDSVTLYYHAGNMLKSYNVTTGSIAVVHTFSEYSSISGNGEMDISLDGDHFVLAGDSHYIFVYQISADKKFAVLDTGTTAFDSLYITPQNNVIVSWYPSGTVRFTGQELFDINMNFLRQVGRADGHKHLTRDTDGSEVLIWTNSADPQPIANCQNGIVKIRLADASETCLLQLDWTLAVHITAPDGNGTAFVETYAPSNPEPGTSGWVAYTNELLQVKLDGSGATRIAHHRSRPWNSYTYEPKMTVSRDGSRLLYASNYDLQKIDGYASEYSDTYMIVLSGAPTAPATPATPPAPQPVPPAAPVVTTITRYEQDNAAVAYTGTWFPNGSGFNSGGTATMAMDAGSQAKLTFTGTAVKWIGFSDPWSGIAQVYLDGALAGTVDTYAADQKTQFVQYSVANLSNTSHTLTIIATGTHSAQSGGAWVWVDAFDVTGQAATQSATPVKPLLNAVVNAASGGAGVAPGALVSIYGAQLAGSSQAALSTPLPVQLNGVSASVNGVAVPLFYVSAGQINAQLPYGVAAGTASLVVTENGITSDPISFTVSATAPEIFRRTGSQALAVNQDQSVNGPDSPAKSGSVIVAYLTGQAAVDNPVASGAAALQAPLARPLAPVTAMLDGQPIPVLATVLAPDLVGIAQANLQLPDVASGNHSLTIQVGDAVSQPVTIAIQ